MIMGMLRILMAVLLLALPAGAEVTRSTGTLQDITRDAQERLKQWDEADAHEQAVQSRYWWVGLLELALSLTFGHAVFSDHGLTFTGNGGLTVRPSPPFGAAAPAGKAGAHNDTMTP